jgi:hypothetical protein
LSKCYVYHTPKQKESVFMIGKLKSEFVFKSFPFEVDEISDEEVTQYLNKAASEGWSLYSTNLALDSERVVQAFVHKKRKKDQKEDSLVDTFGNH